MDPAIPEAIRTMNLNWARCRSAEGVLNGRRLRRGIVGYLRTATYEICIHNNAQQFMRGAGLSFVAGQKKKLTNFDCWALGSRKLDKDKIYEVTF